MSEDQARAILVEFVKAAPAWIQEIRAGSIYTSRRACTVCGADPQNVELLLRAIRTLHPEVT